jgi:hypothetical protein
MRARIKALEEEKERLTEKVERAKAQVRRDGGPDRRGTDFQLEGAWSKKSASMQALCGWQNRRHAAQLYSQSVGRVILMGPLEQAITAACFQLRLTDCTRHFVCKDGHDGHTTPLWILPAG